MSKDTFEKFWAPFGTIIGVITLVINFLNALEGDKTFATFALILVSLVAIAAGIWQYAFAIDMTKPYTKNGKYGFNYKYRYHMVAKSIFYLALVGLIFFIFYTLTFIEIIPDCCGLIPTKTPTWTATPTVTFTPSRTATSTSTPTITPTFTLTPITPPTPYSYFDDFGIDGQLDGKWILADNPPSCTTNVKKGGFLEFECHSITTGKTEYSIYPRVEENQSVKGLSISARVENPVLEDWGKIHLKVDFINPKNKASRTYLMTQRGGIVYVVEYDSGFKKIKSVNVSVEPSEYHKLEVDYKNNNLRFLVDGVLVDFTPDITPEYQWDNWFFEVFISQQSDESKVLRAKVDWIAIMK